MDITQAENSEELVDLLGQVVDEYLECRAAGRQPNLDEYIARHPQLADLIQQSLFALEFVGESLTSCGAVSNEFNLGNDKDLGDYRLLRELGRGGMGVVYEAEQISLRRKVALKVLPFAPLVQDKALKRFHNEVRSAAALNHPNIVAVYSVGEERGIHYYAMQLVRGQSLADVIRGLKRLQSEDAPLTCDSIDELLSAAEGGVTTAHAQVPPAMSPSGGSGSTAEPEPPTHPIAQAQVSTLGTSGTDGKYFRSVAHLGIQAGEALQHAHDLGIMHRDIKPGNLMLGDDMQLYITDFGLARMEADAGVTMTGDLIGTLRYMSPEQAMGKKVVVDHRSDVYSLGATLYELLTMEPPFAAEDRQELLKQIAFEDPPKLRQLNRSIPGELETIVLKAVEKSPDQRYSTAQDLADDLRRFVDQLPIKARTPSLATRLSKWSRRHHEVVLATSACLAIVAILAVVGAAILYGAIHRLNQQRQDVVDAYRLSAELRESRTTGGLLSPRRMLFGPDGELYVTSAGNDSILEYSAKSGEFVANCVPPGLGGLDLPIGMALSQNGSLYVASANSDDVLQFNVPEGEFLGKFPGRRQTAAVQGPDGMALGKDGNLYIAGYKSHNVARFDGTTGKFIDEFVAARSGGLLHPIDLAFGDENDLFVTSSPDCVLRFDGETGAFEGVFAKDGLTNPRGLAFGEGGDLYVSSNGSDEILRYDGSDGTLIGAFVSAGQAGLESPHGLTFGANGDLFVASQSNGKILRYDRNDGSFVAAIMAADQMMKRPHRLAFSPNGNLYVTDLASPSSALRYDFGSGIVEQIVPPGSGGLKNARGLVFTPNGDALVACIDGNKVLRYRAVDGAFCGEFATAGPRPDRPSDLLLHKDGLLYVTSDSGRVMRYHAGNGRFHDIFVEEVAWPRSPVFGPDGDLYLCSYLEHSVVRFDGASGARIGAFITAEHPLLRHPTALAFGPNGHAYVGCDTTSCVLKFDGNSGEFLSVFVEPESRGLRGVTDIEFRDNQMLYVCSRHSNEILRYDGQTGEFVDEFVSDKSSTATASDLLLLAVTLWHLNERDAAERHLQRAEGQLSAIDQTIPQLKKLHDKARNLIRDGKR